MIYFNFQENHELKIFDIFYFSSEKVNKRLVQGLIREFAAKCREVIIQIP